MKKRTLFVALTLVFAASGVDTAWAQVQRQPRDYRGVFGGGNGPDPNQGQSLELQLNAHAGYDDNATQGEVVNVGDPRFQQSSSFWGGGAMLTYGYRTRRVSFFANANGSARQYSDLDWTSEAYGAGAGMSADLSARTSLTAHQSVSWSPYYQLGLLPPVFAPDIGSVVGGSDLNFIVSGLEAWSTYSGVTLAHELSSRGTLTFAYTYNNTDIDSDDVASVGRHSVSGRYTHTLTRDVSARLGYAYHRGNYSTVQLVPAQEGHTIDAGLDYHKALSFSRRTTLSFATGSTILRTQNEFATEERTDFYLTGNLNLNHQMGRTWTTGASYVRQVQFVYGFSAPVLSDNVVAFLDGYVNDRTNLALHATWSAGDVGARQAFNTFDTYSASALVRYALTRFMAVDAQYFYYLYDFANTAGLPPGLHTDYDRHGVRAGLVVWLPLIR